MTTNEQQGEFSFLKTNIFYNAWEEGQEKPKSCVLHLLGDDVHRPGAG